MAEGSANRIHFWWSAFSEQLAACFTWEGPFVKQSNTAQSAVSSYVMAHFLYDFIGPSKCRSSEPCWQDELERCKNCECGGVKNRSNFFCKKSSILEVSEWSCPVVKLLKTWSNNCVVSLHCVWLKVGGTLLHFLNGKSISFIFLLFLTLQSFTVNSISPTWENLRSSYFLSS